MADSFTATLNLRKPEVGHAGDTWGGTAGLNSDLDIIDAIFLATGLGTAVGLHVGPAQVLNVEGGITLKDPTDTTKVVALDRSLLTTATTRTLSFPDENGILATQGYLTRHVPTGSVFSGYYGATAPTGFVFLDGRTIGDATSGATNRANADTVNLYTLFWTLGFTPTGGRGANAAADYAAHKPMPLPDHSGRTMAGRDNLSGTARGNLSGFTTVGVVGGEQSHTLSIGELASHSHSDTGHTHGISGNYINSNSIGTPIGAFPFGPDVPVSQAGTTNSSNAVIGSTGSGAAHNNIQPTIAVDVVIAL